MEKLYSRIQSRLCLSVALCLCVCGKMPWQAELIGAMCAKLRNNSPEIDGFCRPAVCGPLSALALAERAELPLKDKLKGTTSTNWITSRQCNYT